MSDLSEARPPETFDEALAQAAHHRNAMVERRNIGLRVVVGIVAFDLVILRYALDSTGDISDQSELTWALRMIATVAFVVLTGMLCQLEIRNRSDRILYKDAEHRAEKIRRGEPPMHEPKTESLIFTIRQSWATTWPLAGVLSLTIAIWWLAGLAR